MKTCSFCKKQVKQTWKIKVAPVFQKIRSACDSCYNKLRGVY